MVSPINRYIRQQRVGHYITFIEDNTKVNTIRYIDLHKTYERVLHTTDCNKARTQHTHEPSTFGKRVSFFCAARRGWNCVKPYFPFRFVTHSSVLYLSVRLCFSDSYFLCVCVCACIEGVFRWGEPFLNYVNLWVKRWLRSHTYCQHTLQLWINIPFKTLRTKKTNVFEAGLH